MSTYPVSTTELCDMLADMVYAFTSFHLSVFSKLPCMDVVFKDVGVENNS